MLAKRIAVSNSVRTERMGTSQRQTPKLSALVNARSDFIAVPNALDVRHHRRR